MKIDVKIDRRLSRADLSRVVVLAEMAIYSWRIVSRFNFAFIIRLDLFIYVFLFGEAVKLKRNL